MKPVTNTLLSLGLAAALPGLALAQETVTITSGAKGLTYHDVFGANLARILKEQDFSVVLQPSAGSVQNLERLAKGEADLGFLQADVLAHWLKENAGTGVQTLGGLGQECIFIAVSDRSGIDDEDDIGKGTKIAVGGPGTGSAVSWQYMQTLEPDYLEATTMHLGGFNALGQLKAGVIDAYLWVTSPENINNYYLQAVMQPESGMHMINVDDYDMNDELPGGQAVYTFNDDVVIEEGSIFDTKIEVPCTDILVAAREGADPGVTGATAQAIVMNANRIKGR